MSYILDALKKAEADRDPDTRAKLAFEVRERRRSRFITYAVLAALIANAVILLWLFLPEDLIPVSGTAIPLPEVSETFVAETPVSTASVPETSDSTSSSAEASTTPSPVASRPTAPPAAPVTPPVDTVRDRQRGAESIALGPEEILISPSTAPASTGPSTIASLPDAMRRRFPTLSFSTHIYADEPDLRAVVVNGRRLTEGDRLGELTLEKITEDGAVFRFEGRQVEVGLLEDWN